MNEEEIDSSKELHVVKAGVGESTAPGSRIRKSTIQSDFVTNDAEALTTIREYNKQKKIQDALKKTKRKRQERELADAAVAKATVAELQKKPKVNKGSVQKPLNAKQREELEREESLLRIFNERLTHYTLYRTHKLREETWEAKSISDAIRSGIRQSNTLLLDWTHPEVNKIGSLCKVYWDGEKNWFYARILNYDRVHNRHLVYYELDHTAEWIVFENECAMLSEGLILQQYGSNVFPAIYFRSTAKGDEQNSKQKNYKKGAYYVEFLTPNGKNEWNFYYASQMYPIEDKYMPSRISTIFEMKLKLAQEEHEKTESVIKEVLASTAKSVFKVLRGPDWIGLRVRALAHRLVKHGESSEQTALDGVAKCEGTIVSYCGPSDEHFVVFDNPLLQSVWIRCEPSSIDALIGPTEVSCKRTQQLFHQRKYTPDVFVSNPICSMCGLGEVSQNGIEIDSKVSADMGNDTEIVDSVVEDGTEDSGNIALEMQRVSRMKRRDFSDTITANLPSSRTFNAKKSSAFSDSTTSTTLNTCKSCHTHYHSMCLPVYKLNWPLADIELVDGLCWACIRCRGGCDSTAFDTCLIPWSLRRAHEWAPDERKPTCGACMSKYLVEKEYCNVCYKTYPTELSMVPTLETLISPEAQFDDRGTSIDLKNQSSNAENDQLDTEEVNLEYIPYDSSSIPNSVRSPHIFIQYFTEDEFNAKSSIQKFPRPLQDQPSDVDGPKAAGKKGKGRKKRKVEGSSRNTAGESAEEENEKDEGDEEQNKGNGADDKEDDANEKTVVTTIDENNISTIDKVDKVDTSFTVKDVTDPLALPSIESGAIDVEEETANVMNVSTTSIELDNSRMVSTFDHLLIIN